ncbi:two-component sensor histidine kinase, partial [Streptomyces sp. SID7982]|nr:two-component sensor histidine kinase [Streptomyces sp. SID7982]
MRSVRARAALGATLVVAVALIGAGLAVLLVLRDNLIGQADLQAEVAARDVAGQLATGTAYDDVELDDEEDHPVQVVDEEGRVVLVSKDLRALTGTGATGVTPAPSASAGATPSPGDDDDDGDDGQDDDTSSPDSGEVSSDDPEFSDGTATVDRTTADYR